MENINTSVSVSMVNFYKEYRMCLYFSINSQLYTDKDCFNSFNFILGKALSMYMGATMSNYRTQIVFNHTEDFCESSLIMFVVF